MSPSGPGNGATRPTVSKARFVLAFLVAAISDGLSMGLTFLPPAQWFLDIVTAGLLFALLGWRWQILPAFVAEAVPGLGAFPFWVLVVTAVAATETSRIPTETSTTVIESESSNGHKP